LASRDAAEQEEEDTHRHIVGDLTLAYEGLEMAAEPGLTFITYAAESGSPSEDALRLLASWAASPEPGATVQPASTE
jgi:MmyB-like transcription regulator ligand binding domain